ncbi:MAG: segregation/condensation protein A [archaeon]
MKKQTITQSMEEAKEVKRKIAPEKMKLEEIAQRHDWREILKKIVEKEDMDPWNINISKLVDEYIQTIRELQEMDFQVPANAVLASSILLKKKSTSWVIKGEEDEEEFKYWEEIPTTPDQIPPAREEIPEPKPKKRKTKRKVSVEELIDAVEDVIDKEKKKARKKAKETKQPGQNLVPKQLLEIAKRDTKEFEEKTKELEEKIRQRVDKENLTVFTELIEKKEDSGEVVETFIPLLHLADKGKVSIWQEEVFGEIFIYLQQD